MTKRLQEQLSNLKYTNQPLNLNLVTLILTVLCSFLIVIATFTQFDFNHYVLTFKNIALIKDLSADPNAYMHFLKHYRYIPQIPIIMFIVAFLGRKLSITSIVLYIIAGLFLAPVFALGGGFQYIFEYGFGYIIAYIPAVFFAGSILQSCLSFRNMAQATLVGVLTIHIIGILYMLFVATIQKENFGLISGWIAAQSGTKIIYDLLFGFIAMVIAKFTKKIMWVAIG